MDYQSYVTKKDMMEFKEEIIHQFHSVSENVLDHIILLAEGQTDVVRQLGQVRTGLRGVETNLDKVEVRLGAVEIRLDRMGKENEHPHLETRACQDLLHRA